MAERKLEDQLDDLLDSSGFPFQVGLQYEIETTSADHGWEVAGREYPWRHSETADFGFADLIIQHSQFIFTIVIECKRDRGGKWVFLTPRGTAATGRLSAFWTDHMGGELPDIGAWADFEFTPESAEAAFCVLPKQDERNPLIERTADNLLQAVESVGMEEAGMKGGRERALGDRRLYLPVIVTNAKLYAAVFDAGKVSMETGTIAPGECDYRPVPCIRFRKGLRTTYPNEGTRADHSGSANILRSALATKERTILVINSAALAGTLKLVDCAGHSFGVRIEAMARRMRQ